MPTVTWARLDPIRRAAVVEAAEAEFGAHGFSQGSLNVIARRAGVAKGSLFQYFADKRDLYAFIADVGSQRVRAYMEARILELDAEQAILRISDRPARLLGRVLRRSSAGTLASCRGEFGGRHGRAHQRADRHSPPLLGGLAATRTRRARAWRPARGRRHRRVVVAAAADLPAPGAGALRARNGSDPRTRRAHPGAAGTRGAQARRRPGGRVRQTPHTPATA